MGRVSIFLCSTTPFAKLTVCTQQLAQKTANELVGLPLHKTVLVWHNSVFHSRSWLDCARSKRWSVRLDSSSLPGTRLSPAQSRVAGRRAKAWRQNAMRRQVSLPFFCCCVRIEASEPRRAKLASLRSSFSTSATSRCPLVQRQDVLSYTFFDLLGRLLQEIRLL